jgi:hypothetical protein
MLTGNSQNGKAKRRLESRFEGEPGWPFFGLRHMNVPSIASGKFLDRPLHTEQAN